MNNWKVPSYTRRDGNKACWVVEDKPRPKSICRCFGPKGEEHAQLIAAAPDLLTACENVKKVFWLIGSGAHVAGTLPGQIRAIGKALNAAIDKANKET